MDTTKIDSPEQLKNIISTANSEIEDLNSQIKDLSKPNGGSMLKMFGIDKKEAIKKLQMQVEEKQAQVTMLENILNEVA